MNRMDLDEEDEVVAEYDVRLLPPNAAVYLLQFPLRPRNFPLNTERTITGGRVRPQQKRLEMNLNLVPNQGSQSFDDARLRNFGSKPQQKMVGAAATAGHMANYVAAKFNGKTLNLVAIDAILQMRPDFAYVDTFWAQTGGNDGAKADTDHGETTAGEESGVEAIDVKFKRRESEKAEERRKKSHAYLVKKQEEEAWIDLDVHMPPDEACVSAEQRLFTSIKAETDRCIQPSSAREYVKMLSPMSEIVPRVHGKSIMDSFLGPFSLREIRALPLNLAVDEIIKRVRIVKLETVCQMLDYRYQANDVFKALEPMAFTLQGNWVASTVPGKKANSDLAQAARDVILFLFRDQEVVSSAQAQRRAGGFLPPPVIEEILGDVADRSRGVGWRLRLQPDEETIRTFSTELERHKKEHEERTLKADEVLKRASSKS